MFLAFNKSIADELQRRVPGHVRAQTTHSIGFAAVRNSLGQVKMEQHKCSFLVQDYKDNFKKEEWRAASVKIKRLVSLAKNHCVGGLMDDSTLTWNYLNEHFIVDADDMMIKCARDVLTRSIEDTRTIDFDDMIFLPVLKKMKFNKLDWIFVDEAQDLSQVQLEMLKLIVKPDTGRLVAVGDPHQAIYGFRGADSKSIERIKSEFKAIELPLSISYRCSKAAVAAAKEYVPHIEASESANAGEIAPIEKRKVDSELRAGDMVLCRFKAPVISLAYRLLKANKPAQVLGRDIAEGLVSLIEKLGAKNVSVLVQQVNEWRYEEIQKLLKKDENADTSVIEDRAESILAFCENSKATKVKDLIVEIRGMFGDGDDNSIIKLSTIHKAKGLESERVFIIDLGWSFKKKLQEWQLEQEDNLRYVAITRTKNFLGLIE